MDGWGRVKVCDATSLYVAAGGSFRATAKFRNSTWSLTAPSWWPSPGSEWRFTNPYSCWVGDDGSFLIGSWPRLPKVGVEVSCLGRLPSDNAELIASVPRGLSSPASLAACALLRAGPPAPPRDTAEWGQVSAEGASEAPTQFRRHSSFPGEQISGGFRISAKKGGAEAHGAPRALRDW